MGDGFHFLDIILFAAIAAFFALRLRSVLGKRTGNEKPPSYDPFKQRKAEPEEEEKVIPLPDRSGPKEAEAREDTAKPAGGEAGASPLEAGLTQIKLADREFDEERFQAGARAAFEMIVGAYAEGDTRTLRSILSNDVYEDFAGAISERQRAGHRLETTLVGISEAQIVEAELQGRTAFVTVKFVSDQVNVVYDKQGRALEGDVNEVHQVTDIWTFARNTRSRDPNWTLVATQSPN